MTSRRAENDEPTVMRFLEATPVNEEGPATSLYEVAWGCIAHASFQPDGTWLTTEDHQPDCECQKPDDHIGTH